MTRQRIGDRFVLRDVLGRGGMGTVWRAHDTLLDRLVALKEVTLSAGSAEHARTKVLREARLAARLDHPGAVTVFDAVQDDGQVFPREAADLGLRLLDVLTAAHQLGIVHRDVKPGNVMVSGHGVVKLADFGIARLGDDPIATTSGIMVGSPAYMAPEQIRGQPTASADLWSLAATLYYAVEGRSPFRRDTVGATLAAVLADEPSAPTRAGQEFARLLLDTLAKQPEHRPSVDQVRQRLMATIGTATVAAPPPGWAPSADPAQQAWAAPVPPPPVRRDPWLVFAGLGCLAGTFGLGVIAFDAKTPQLPGVELIAVKGMPPLGMLVPGVLVVMGLALVVIGFALFGRKRQGGWGAFLAGTASMWLSFLVVFAVIATRRSGVDEATMKLSVAHLILYGPAAAAAVIAACRVLRGPVHRRWVAGALAAAASLTWFVLQVRDGTPVLAKVVLFLAIVGVPVAAAFFGRGRLVLAGWTIGLGLKLLADVIMLSGYRYLSNDAEPHTEIPTAWTVPATLTCVAMLVMIVAAVFAGRSATTR